MPELAHFRLNFLLTMPVRVLGVSILIQMRFDRARIERCLVRAHVVVTVKQTPFGWLTANWRNVCVFSHWQPVLLVPRKKPCPILRRANFKTDGVRAALLFRKEPGSSPWSGNCWRNVIYADQEVSQIERNQARAQEETTLNLAARGSRTKWPGSSPRIKLGRQQ